MRNKNLDILRAIAILLVLGRHGPGPVFWRNVGWVGVDLFFVLSGFLISGLLFAEYKKTGGINWGRFFIRRGFKIYPSFYAMMSATLLWQIAEHTEIPWKRYLPELFFYQSYQSYRLWGQTWSLAVEEHFYIFLPLLLFLILKLQRKGSRLEAFGWIPFVWVILAVGCLLRRLQLTPTLLDLPVSYSLILCPTHLRIDSLFFGVLLGYLHHFHSGALKQITGSWLSRVSLLLGSALLVSTCVFFPLGSRFMLSFGLTALYIGFGGILLLSVYPNPGKPLRFTGWLQKSKVPDFAAYIGMYSYSIYLWHGMVSQHYQGLMRLIWPGMEEATLFWFYILISLAGGIVLSQLIEYPALRVRDRLFPSLVALRGTSDLKATLKPVTSGLGVAVVAENPPGE